MSRPESRYGVWLGRYRVGTLVQRGDHASFALTDEYRSDPHRPVLGLIFEQDLNKRHSGALRLPPWFSNLLPEGRLREWVAADRGVSIDREMELLAQVGHDLPGAVRVLPEEALPDLAPSEALAEGTEPYEPFADERHRGWRFSLAGVAMKFSMVKRGDRLTLPAAGEGGDWIVKLPDMVYPDVPRNEYAMMSLADAVGIEVPEVKLLHHSEVANLPSNVWPDKEEWAYAVRRFDRADGGGLVHIEDLAQVRNVYPDRKYSGNFETVAALIYRRRDLASLREFARRMAFVILISDGDSHLKNWSLIYQDRRIPRLSPAYDLVSTACYRVHQDPEDLGMKFGGSKLFDRVSLDTFAWLQAKIGAPSDAGLPEVVAETVERVQAQWPKVASLLSGNQQIQDAIDRSIASHGRTLLRRVNP